MNCRNIAKLLDILGHFTTFLLWLELGGGNYG